jgi:hypothetical protein
MNLGEDCVEAADVNGGVMKCFPFWFLWSDSLHARVVKEK